MLGKLMKYDLRSGIRTFSLIWIGLALLGAINGLTIRFVLAGDTQSGLVSFVFGVLPMILLVALYVAMGIFVLVFIIDRFYKGLLGNEGYLMFTLPVTSTAHIASKALTSMIFSVASAIVALLSGVLLMAVLTPLNFSDVAQAFQEAGRYLRGGGFDPANLHRHLDRSSRKEKPRLARTAGLHRHQHRLQHYYEWVHVTPPVRCISQCAVELGVLLGRYRLACSGRRHDGLHDRHRHWSGAPQGHGLLLRHPRHPQQAPQSRIKKKRSRPENFLTGSFARKNAENRKITVVSPRCKWQRWTAAGTRRRKETHKKPSPPDRVSGGDGRLSGIHPMNRLRPSRARVSAAALSRMARNTVSLPESEPTSPGREAMPSTAVHTAGASPGSVLMMTRFWQA